ncbi:hypothetical protein ACIBI7_22675 [Nonomuraea fuscirosea]|uniref:hypothetical protein n=1 Tax=Nonomuraea fuscirosea TaxID=1291556 RepID=UPI0037A3BABD
MGDDRYPGRLVLPLSFPGRRFRMWSYLPTHSELVLRTEFDPAAPHIELLFKPVHRIDLPVTMDGGLIIDVGDHPADDANTAMTFTVANDHFTGHVIADHLFLCEEHRSKYSAFSLFHGYLHSDFTR